MGGAPRAPLDQFHYGSQIGCIDDDGLEVGRVAQVVLESTKGVARQELLPTSPPGRRLLLRLPWPAIFVDRVHRGKLSRRSHGVNVKERLTLITQVVSARSERRNITAGQKAMAHAMLWQSRGKGQGGGCGKKTSLGAKEVYEAKGFSEAGLSQARTVYAYSPELAREVRDGNPPASAHACDACRGVDRERQSL
jgi:hypothetical protein